MAQFPQSDPLDLLDPLDPLGSFPLPDPFPQSDPFRWNQLPSGTNRQLGSYGGGNGQSGSINIAGREFI